MGRPASETSTFREFPSLITNPQTKDAGAAATDVALNMLPIDSSRGRSRRGLDLFNSDDFDSPLGVSIRAESPPVGSVGALIPVVAASAGDLIGLFQYIPRSATRFPGFSAASNDDFAYLELQSSTSAAPGAVLVNLAALTAANYLVSAASTLGQSIQVQKGANNYGYFMTRGSSGPGSFGQIASAGAYVRSTWDPSGQTGSALNVLTAFGLSPDQSIILLAGADH